MKKVALILILIQMTIEVSAAGLMMQQLLEHCLASTSHLQTTSPVSKAATIAAATAGPDPGASERRFHGLSSHLYRYCFQHFAASPSLSLHLHVV